MWPSVSAVVLLSALLLIVSFPAVTVATDEDCWDDPLADSKTYNNCTTCYQTFAKVLIYTANNKYNLSRAFFPINAVPPVQVRVTYHNMGSGNDSVWYWLVGGFYLFQPLELFLYRSLFFSHPTWRQQSLTILLPEQCFWPFSEHYFEYTTQRVSIIS